MKSVKKTLSTNLNRMMCGVGSQSSLIMQQCLLFGTRKINAGL